MTSMNEEMTRRYSKAYERLIRARSEVALVRFELLDAFPSEIYREIDNAIARGLGKLHEAKKDLQGQ